MVYAHLKNISSLGLGQKANRTTTNPI